MDKRLLRKHYIYLRSAQPTQLKTDASLKICKKVINDPLWINADKVMIYAAYNSEVDVWHLAKIGMELGKKIYLPVIDGNTMQACRIKSLDFEKDYCKDRYGILEPRDMTECADANGLDLVIAPMVAADMSKFRLGYGGGFYDRFLQKSSVPAIGVCYDVQLLGENVFLPSEEHDIKMSRIYTESFGIV